MLFNVEKRFVFRESRDNERKKYIAKEERGSFILQKLMGGKLILRHTHLSV